MTQNEINVLFLFQSNVKSDERQDEEGPRIPHEGLAILWNAADLPLPEAGGKYNSDSLTDGLDQFPRHVTSKKQ